MVIDKYDHKIDRAASLRRRLAEADDRLYGLQEDGRLTEARAVMHEIARLEEEILDIEEDLYDAR